jgi:hypothetical protein
MKALMLAISTAVCLIAIPAFEDAIPPSSAITVAQAEVRTSPNPLDTEERIRDRERDRYHDRVRARLGDRDPDERESNRRCQIVTVEEHGKMITTRHCD